MLTRRRQRQQVRWSLLGRKITWRRTCILALATTRRCIACVRIRNARALAAIRRAPPAVVVSDVMMPELDGFGLALAMRQDPQLRDVPLVLMTSSYVEAKDRELARRAGATELVIRTPDLVELIELPPAVHPWFFATQFHPEFNSNPRDGHPLFTSFITAARSCQGLKLPRVASA